MQHTVDHDRAADDDIRGVDLHIHALIAPLHRHAGGLQPATGASLVDHELGARDHGGNVSFDIDRQGAIAVRIVPLEYFLRNPGAVAGALQDEDRLRIVGDEWLVCRRDDSVAVDRVPTGVEGGDPLIVRLWWRQF
jgi:hypothetical protein